MKNTLKKLSVILSLFAIMFCFAACSDKTEEAPNSIVGTWKFEQNGDVRELITKIIDDSSVYTDIYYEFYEDGTGCTYSTLFEGKIEFTYEYDGETVTITSPDGTFDAKCDIDGDSMVIEEYEETAVFERQ